MPSQEMVVALDAQSAIPSESAVNQNGFAPGPVGDGIGKEKKMVYLETLNLPPTRPPTLRGSGESASLYIPVPAFPEFSFSSPSLALSIFPARCGCDCHESVLPEPISWHLWEDRSE